MNLDLTPGVTYRVHAANRVELAKYLGHNRWQVADGTMYFLDPNVIATVEIVVEELPS